MRNTIAAIALTAAAALSTPAFAQSVIDPGTEPGAAVLGGAAIGTVAGIGLYNGWWG